MTWDMSRRDGPFCEGCEAVHKDGQACPGCGTKTCRGCGWCCECADRTAAPAEPAAEVSSDPPRTPWQADRDRAEKTGKWPESWGPFHRHFANDAVHRDGGPECDQPGTPRRVYVFDPDIPHEHEMIVARYAIDHPEQFTPQGDGSLWSPSSSGS